MKLKFLLCAALFFLLPQIAMAQQDLEDGFKHARAKAETKDYNGALKILDALEKKYPENEDIRVYQGRVYSWKRDFSKAKKVLRPLADRDKPNIEALQAAINAYYWSYDYEACITYCDKYLETEPNAEDILMIKAACLEKAGRDAEALQILNTIGPEDSNEKTSSLRSIISHKRKNAISASYLNISTVDPGQGPTHYAYIEYLRKFTKSTLIGRFNVGNRDSQSEVQYEVDYYRTFGRSYLYTNAAYSSRAGIFPEYRLGAEYYFAPQGQFDFSLGGRYMRFPGDPGTNIVLATGQAAYRFSDYTLAYRPYYDIDNSLMSHVVSIQKTNELKESLIRLELQYGNVPYLYLYNNVTQPLAAYRAGIQYQHRFGDSFFVRPIFLYEYEEYIPDTYRHKFNCQIIFTKRF